MDEIIDTVLGPLEARLLERRITHTTNDRERTTRTEYWFMGRLVRSDVSMTLLQGSIVPSAVGRFA